MPILVFTFDGKETGRCAIWNTPFTIGTSPQVSLPIESPDISEKHCTFNRDKNTYSVTDLDSETGLFVNGAKTDKAEITTGDVISIGSLEIIFLDPAKKQGPVEADSSGIMDANITIQGDVRLSSIDVTPKVWFLEAVTGGDEELHPLTEPEYIIGSSSSCDIVIKGWGIASHHAALVRSDISVRLIPLTDKKTFLNDAPLNERAVLKASDVVRIGKYSLTLLKR